MRKSLLLVAALAACSATGDRQPAAGDRQPATGDRRPATGDRRPATGDRRPVDTRPQPIPTGGGGGGQGQGQGQGQRFGEATVYLDGDPIAVMRYPELPPWLPTRPQTLIDGRQVVRFRVAEYIESLGIPLGRVRAVHFYGGRGRVAVVSHDALESARRTFLFSFTRGTGGKARLHFPAGEPITNDSIDTVAMVAIYVDREPPQWDDERFELNFPGGAPITGIPYARGELRGGTRVYLDGRLVGSLKRNLLVESMVEPDRSHDGEPRYPLLPYLASRGVRLGRVGAFELFDGDSIVTRLQGRAARADLGHLAFAASPHQQGRTVIHYGDDRRPADATVSAIAFYSPARAAARFRR